METETTSIITLPATRRDVPAELAEFSVSSLKQMQTHDGVAFTANVRRKGHKGIVGTIENEGRGGPTTFYHHDREAREAWDVAIEACKPLAEAETFTYTDVEGNEVTDSFSADYAYELAPELLLAEYETAKPLNRYLKRGELSVQTDDHERGEFVTYKTDDVERVKSHMAQAEPGVGYWYWTADGWVRVDA